jgi:2-methylcitrate dehydratase PrpD
MSITREIAAYAANFTYRQLPAEVIDRTKQLIIDTVGCMFGGLPLAVGRLIVDFMLEMGGKPEATIIGDGRATIAKHAAFANAQLGRALDYDETYRNGGHPGAPTVAAALAVAEREGSSGEEILGAVAVAYDVAARVGDAMNPSLARRKTGVYPFATWEIFGPAVAAGRLLGLGAERMYHAIGIAAATTTLPTGGKNHDAPMGMHKCREGWHAENGVMAALLAARGFTGLTDILDSDVGFGACAGSDRWEWQSLTRGLGETFGIMRASFKAQPVCRLINIPIEAFLKATEGRTLPPERVDKILVKSNHASTWSSYDNPSPYYGSPMASAVSAQFSIQWGLAMAALGYEPGPDWYGEEAFSDPRVPVLAKKVEIGVDAEADRLFARDSLHSMAVVEVQANGEQYSSRVEYAEGDPVRPMSWERVQQKFARQARRVIGDQRAGALFAKLRALEQVRELGTLVPLWSADRAQ